MRRAALVLAFGALGAVTIAAAQDAGVAAPIRLPIAVHGVVHREASMGCGQSWTGDVAVSTVSLAIDARRRAVLSVRTRIAEESGGVSLLGPPERYHSSSERSVDVSWSGRARVTGAVTLVTTADWTRGSAR